MNLMWQISFPSTVLIFLTCSVLKATAWESMWAQHYDQTYGKDYNIYPNYMFKNAFVWVEIICSSEMTTVQPQVEVAWILQKIDCMEEMYLVKTRTTAGISVALSRSQQLEENNSTDELTEENYDLAEFQASPPKIYSCGPQTSIISLVDESSYPYYTAYIPKGHFDQDNFADTPIARKEHQRPTTSNNFHGNDLKYRVVDAWSEGMFHFLLSLSAVGNVTFDAKLYVQMRSAHGYLPAITWPQLPVCGVMAFVYLLIGSIWIILWAKAHQHSHKIHLIIGCVSLAGAFWNTLMFVELTTVNDSGTGLPGVLWSSRFLSCLQLSLTQLLLLIVSTGYGINRPSLSRGLVVFPSLFAALVFLSNLALMVVQDEHLRVQYERPMVAKMCYVFYAVVAITVAVWIMVYSVLTFVHLCHRRHSDHHKFVAFCIFMAACIVTFIGLLVMLVFSNGIFIKCRTDWQHEWLLSTFGQIQVVILLVVLMWLWRPSDEQQSYGFQPLSTKEDGSSGELRLNFTDESDQEEENVLLDRNANDTEDEFKTTPM